jgi:sugar lactone lactonase YvrE
VKRFFGVLLLIVLAAAAYLLAWPVPLEPVAWTPPPAPALEGSYAVNDRLKAVERLADGQGHGPEAIAFDADGRLYTGYADGRVMRFAADGADPSLVANTGGRPLGLKFAPDGRLIVADAHKGLIHVAPGSVAALVTEVDGRRIGFADDLAITRDGVVYFTDASSKFGYPGTVDFIEHGANGSLVRHDLKTGKTDVVARNLHFPNGVALGPDDAYLLLNEQAEYRVLRYWLTGANAGKVEPVIENLPGLPDNITYDDAGRRFWIALTTPRLRDLDALLPYPFARKIVYRLPAFAQPAPVMHGFVLALDVDGNVVANLQDAGPGAYAPVTSAVVHDGFLYLGSFTATSFARLPLDRPARQPMTP